MALGGAVLAELALVEAGRAVREDVALAIGQGATGGRPTPEDPVLARASRPSARRSDPPRHSSTQLGKGLTSTLAERLAERGFLQRRDDKVLGLFPRTRWPARDNSHEESVRRALTVVLVDGGRPDPRTAALVALLHAVDRAHKTVPHDGIGSRQVRKRAKQVAEGQWAAKAVKDAIAAAAAASSGG